MDVTGANAARSFHGHGGGKALAPRGGAAVQHPEALLQSGAPDAQTAGGVLDVKEALLKGGKLFKASGAAQHQALRHPAVRRRLHPFPAELLQKGTPVGFQGVYLDDGFGGLIIGLQNPFQGAFGQSGFQKRYQLRRVAVAVFIRRGLLQRSLGADSIAQNCVYQPVAARGSVFSRQGHGLIDGGTVGDLVHVVDLIQPHVENIPDRRVKLF